MAFPIIFLIAHTYYKFALQQLAFIRIRKSAKLKEVVRMMERVSNLEG
ncbi:MAG: hypothetical protein NTX03_13285 [Bacteroidetes bacterium]|nr:hypothetical protein [Bacteroidota bacterium]